MLEGNFESGNFVKFELGIFELLGFRILPYASANRKHSSAVVPLHSKRHPLTKSIEKNHVKLIRLLRSLESVIDVLHLTRCSYSNLYYMM